MIRSSISVRPRVPAVHRRFRRPRGLPGQPRLRARGPRDPRGRRGGTAARAGGADRAPCAAGEHPGRHDSHASEIRHPKRARSVWVRPRPSCAAPDPRGGVRRDRPLRGQARRPRRSRLRRPHSTPRAATCTPRVRGAAQPVRTVPIATARRPAIPHNGIAIADESHPLLALFSRAAADPAPRPRAGERPPRRWASSITWPTCRCSRTRGRRGCFRRRT